MELIFVTSFYRFYQRSDAEVSALGEACKQFAASTGLRGLVILAKEGINSTVSGSSEVICQFKEWIVQQEGFQGLLFKDSECDKQPFRRFRVDIRPEIVTFGHRQANQAELDATMLSPAEWNKRFQATEPPIVVDLRNSYETAVGKFRGAIDPVTDVFTQVPEFVQRANLPKDREILMYCTGGIRCEKALGFMLDQGYSKVRQLSGGILKYLEEFPNGAFEGECFVFDHRVAVDQNLEPSERYRLCPHCGDPGDRKITCGNCGKEARLCPECEKDSSALGCSKNCAHHLARKAQRGASELR